MEYLIAFLLNVAAGVVVYELYQHRRRCRWIIEIAICRLPEEMREARRREWLADHFDTRGLRATYRHALGCWLSAPAVARTAEQPAVSTRKNTEARPDVSEKQFLDALTGEFSRIVSSIDYLDQQNKKIREAIRENLRWFWIISWSTGAAGALFIWWDLLHPISRWFQ
jgi:hypothetical protein